MKDDVHKYPQDSMNSFSMLCILRKAMFRSSLFRRVVKVIRVFSIWNLFLFASIGVQQDFHIR